MMVDDNWNRKNLLLHRLIYAVNNDLEYSFEWVCLHANDDRNDNSITNLYLWDSNKSTSDKSLAQWLLWAYKNKTMFEFLENREYSEIR